VACDEKAPRAEREWAVALEAMPKYVASSTRRDFPWVNTIRVEGDLPEAMKQLKEACSWASRCWRSSSRSWG
jgi:hypothetical protein